MVTSQRARGDRELDAVQLSLVEQVRSLAEPCMDVLLLLRHRDSVDQHWVSIGEIRLQEALMALTRAIAKPGGF
jgi:hypothetical protein